MEWVASILHTTSPHGVSSITNADAHTSAASSRLNWRPRRFNWTRPFRRKTKSGFWACAITFQTQSTYQSTLRNISEEPRSHLYHGGSRKWRTYFCCLPSHIHSSTKIITYDEFQFSAVTYLHSLWKQSNTCIRMTSRRIEIHSEDRSNMNQKC